LNVNTYFLEWKNRNAEVFAIMDISEEKNKLEELENHAYRDSLTQLYNRAYGMLTMESWLKEKKKFSVIFADLDGLKYINDEFGHNDGDAYIANAAKHLKTFSPSVAAGINKHIVKENHGESAETVVCRIGGDEFMVLASDLSYDEVYSTMIRIFNNFQNDEYLKNKDYSYSISFGIATVDKENKLPASDILSVADERMYENKRMRKKERQK